jgi:hypothetical protein
VGDSKDRWEAGLFTGLGVLGMAVLGMEIVGRYLNIWETVYWEVIRIWGRTSLMGSNRILVLD